MPNTRPFHERFPCSKAGKTVSITGRDVELRDGQGNVVNVARGNRSCSGTPACGTMLGADNCPYKTSLNTGR